MGIGPFELADVKISQVRNEPFSPGRRDQITSKIEHAKASEPLKPSFAGTGEKIGENHSEIISANLAAELDPSIVTTRIQIVLPNGSRKVVTISASAKVTDLYLTVRKE